MHKYFAHRLQPRKYFENDQTMLLQLNIANDLYPGTHQLKYIETYLDTLPIHLETSLTTRWFLVTNHQNP